MGSIDQALRHKLSVRDYHKMGDAGVFPFEARIELIDGEIVDMASIGSNHSGRVNRLTHSLVKAVGDQAIVQVQNPVRLGDWSEPQPDLVLLRPRSDFYSDSTAEAGDVLLLVEIADSSLEYDRDTKIPLYASHGIPEVWLVDVRNRLLTVFREPAGTMYRSVQTSSAIHQIGIERLPGITIDLADLL
jgi:Uma2 family endonuclease